MNTVECTSETIDVHKTEVDANAGHRRINLGDVPVFMSMRSRTGPKKPPRKYCVLYTRRKISRGMPRATPPALSFSVRDCTNGCGLPRQRREKATILLLKLAWWRRVGEEDPLHSIPKCSIGSRARHSFPLFFLEQ